MVEPILLSGTIVAAMAVGSWIASLRLLQGKNPTVVYKTDVCPICLSPHNHPQVLQNCGHAFCRGCIQAHRQRAYGMSKFACPVCRAPFKEAIDRTAVATQEQDDDDDDSSVTLSLASSSSDTSLVDSLDLIRAGLLLREETRRPLANVNRQSRQSAQATFQQLEAAAEAQVLRSPQRTVSTSFWVDTPAVSTSDVETTDAFRVRRHRRTEAQTLQSPPGRSTHVVSAPLSTVDPMDAFRPNQPRRWHQSRYSDTRTPVRRQSRESPSMDASSDIVRAFQEHTSRSRRTASLSAAPRRRDPPQVPPSISYHSPVDTLEPFRGIPGRAALPPSQGRVCSEVASRPTTTTREAAASSRVSTIRRTPAGPNVAANEATPMLLLHRSNSFTRLVDDDTPPSTRLYPILENDSQARRQTAFQRNEAASEAEALRSLWTDQRNVRLQRLVRERNER